MSGQTRSRGRATKPTQPAQLRSANPAFIEIPRTLHDQPIRRWTDSNRLLNFLEANGFEKLGHLHGLPFDYFPQMPRFGRGLLAELRALVRSAGQPQTRRAAPGPRQGRPGCYFIPAHARDLKLSELPLSTRLENILNTLRFVRLGDLHGVAERELLALRNCGVTTVRELARLIERAGTGEFNPPKPPFAPGRVGDLLRLLDQLLARLARRDRQVFLERVGAVDGRPWKLEEVGRKHGFTRERARQILEDRGTRLRRLGGPPLHAWLRGLAGACGRGGLTAERLEQWLGSRTRGLNLPLAAYCRLLNFLIERLPR